MEKMEKTKKQQVWILTFNRPVALSRQIKRWGSAGYDVHVFSNYPKVQYTDQEAADYVTSLHFNSLSYEDSNAWCARSWNSIFIKAFMNGNHEDSVFVQDDTDCGPGTTQMIEENAPKFDLIWGPAGDTFFYMKKEVLRRVGWFDERFLGCYCGDADFMYRIWRYYKRIDELAKLSIEETHDWGWIQNPIGIRNNIRWDLASKAIDATYENQHEEMERKLEGNPVLKHSQSHFKQKWKFVGNGINEIGALSVQSDSMKVGTMYDIGDPYEIDWYPWATKKIINNG